jgi:hypothetical protein
VAAGALGDALGHVAGIAIRSGSLAGRSNASL